MYVLEGLEYQKFTEVSRRDFAQTSEQRTSHGSGDSFVRIAQYKDDPESESRPVVQRTDEAGKEYQQPPKASLVVNLGRYQNVEAGCTSNHREVGLGYSMRISM
jgi:hypothetical protein